MLFLTSHSVASSSQDTWQLFLEAVAAGRSDSIESIRTVDESDHMYGPTGTVHVIEPVSCPPDWQGGHFSP